MKFELLYSGITLEEIEKYKHFDFICDGDRKRITSISNLEKKPTILDILRKEIGEKYE